MFLTEWREFPSGHFLQGGGTWWELAPWCCWNRARPRHASELVSFLVGLRNYQHPDTLTETSANSKDARNALRCWCLVLSAIALCLNRLFVINERDMTITFRISFQWRVGGWGRKWSYKFLCLCDRASLIQQYKQPTRCNNNRFYW